MGLISDTHGLLRPEAVAALAGVERIVHAGDVGSPEVLAALRRIAPVHAVRGNVDTAPWARSLPEREAVPCGEVFVYVLHDLTDLDLDPAVAGFVAVVHGHSHRPAVENRGGVLYLNPGSAGPRRFGLPVTVALLHVRRDSSRAEIVHLG